MSEPNRADFVAAWGIGIGIGLMALQMTWLIANRIATLLWGVPVGPTVGFATAVVVGIGVSIAMGRRFVAKTARPREMSAQHGSVETATE